MPEKEQFFRKEEGSEKQQEEFPLRQRTNYGEEVIRPLNIKEKEVFVDVGAGVGLATVMAAQKKSAEGIGIELDKPTAELAKKISKIIELIPRNSQAAEYLAEILEKGTGEDSSEKHLEFLQEKIRQLKERNFTPEQEQEMKSFIVNWLAERDLFRFYQNLKNRVDNLDEELKKTPPPENINFLQADASHLPLKDNSADKILCADVIHWIPEEKDRKKALKEILRIAKNGSLIYVFSDPFWADRKKSAVLKEKEATTAQEEIERIAEEERVLLKRRPAEGVPGRQFLYEVIKNVEAQQQK